jgi:hypothetical protein
MKVKIQLSENNKNNLSFSDFFQGENRSIVLLTHYREERSYHENINALILERLVKLDLHNISWPDIPKTLRDYFLNLNWELYAQFRKYDSDEMGVSVFLAVIEEKSICFVASGRFLTGAVTHTGLEELGRTWDNFHIKTKEDLCLIGSMGQDIEINPLIYSLSEDSLFLVIPSDKAEILEQSRENIYDINSKINNENLLEPFPYCLVSHIAKNISIKRSWHKAKRFRLTAALMILMLLFSIYYLFMGKEAVDDRLHVTREQFQLTIRNIDILKLQEILPLDYGILLVPQRNIELTVEWESTLPFPVTLKPFFCMRNIYLVSGKTLYAYDKKDKKNSWKTHFSGDIIALEILDANLILAITNDNKNICLKRDNGEIVWSIGEPAEELTFYATPPYHPVQISLEMDRRLNSGIILLPQQDGLILVNALNGDTLSHYSAEETITHVSDFDLLEKSIYMIKGEKLYKVRFDVRN